MLPSPQVGQIVRIETSDDLYIVEAVSADGGLVELVARDNPKRVLKDVPCLDLLWQRTFHTTKRLRKLRCRVAVKGLLKRMGNNETRESTRSHVQGLSDQANRSVLTNVPTNGYTNLAEFVASTNNTRDLRGSCP